MFMESPARTPSRTPNGNQWPAIVGISSDLVDQTTRLDKPPRSHEHRHPSRPDPLAVIVFVDQINEPTSAANSSCSRANRRWPMTPTSLPGTPLAATTATTTTTTKADERFGVNSGRRLLLLLLQLPRGSMQVHRTRLRRRRHLLNRPPLADGRR